MISGLPYKAYACGDHAVCFSFGYHIDPDINRYIIHLFQLLKKSVNEGVLDIIPAYTTLTIIYDPLRVLNYTQDPVSFFEQQVASIVTTIKNDYKEEKDSITIPVCYDPLLAPDIESLATTHGLSVNDVIDIHTAVTYQVYMNGFLPGFAYMGVVDERIATPRLASPRKIVPAGSVGIAGKQTGIYPLNSPGGWQLIGKTPVRLFNTQLNNPCLLSPGMLVQFHPITIAEFENYDKS